MRLFNKKAIILVAAVLTVFLLAASAAQKKYQFMFLESALSTVFAPIEYVMSKVGYGFRAISTSTQQLINAYNENEILRGENAQLRQDVVAVNEIAAENARLQNLLNYKNGTPQFKYVVAAVIARDPSQWTNIIMINRGIADGIRKDMPVVNPQGLVGSVSQVFEHTAKIQLILDPRSAVGAIVQRPESRVAAIVEGNKDSKNSFAPRMVNIARDADVVKDDKILTSGFGGIYPKGLLIGDVVDVVNEEGGLLKYAVLKPAVDFDKLEEVMVIVQSTEPPPAVPGVSPANKADTKKGAEAVGGTKGR